MINIALNILEPLNYSIAPYVTFGLAVIFCIILIDIGLKIKKENKFEIEKKEKEELKNAL